MKISLKKKVEAAVNVDDIRRHFYDNVAVGDQYWWWICAMYVDPQEIIIDTDEGDIYRMSYDIKNETVDFGEPQLVKIQYVNASALPKKAQAAAAVAGMNTIRPDRVLVAFSSREESRPVDVPNQEGDDVNLSRLRTILGLSADSTDEEVLSAAEAQLDTPENPAPAAEPPVEPVAPDDPAAQDDPEAPHEGGAVVVDASVLASLRADAEAGRAARNEQLQERDEAVLAQAVRLGKIPPARKKHYEAALKADREGTTALLESLSADLVPVEQRGGTSDSVEEGQVAASVGYPENWLPDIAVRKAQIAAGARSRVTIG